MISSVPLPYATEKEAILRGNGAERCIPFLITAAVRLEKAGAEFIVMPCNSLHMFIKELRESVGIPVLSIVDETVRFLTLNKMHRVSVLSTLLTRKARLYETALADNGIECTLPNEHQQTKINRLIHYQVMGKHNDHDREELLRIINYFTLDGSDCVVLACTDLQLLLTPNQADLKIIDTMKILADAAVVNIFSS
jgi:aspartate racemase